MNSLLNNPKFMAMFEQSRSNAHQLASKRMGQVIENVYSQMFDDLQQCVTDKRPSTDVEFAQHIIETTGKSELLADGELSSIMLATQSNIIETIDPDARSLSSTLNTESCDGEDYFSFDSDELNDFFGGNHFRNDRGDEDQLTVTQAQSEINENEQIYMNNSVNDKSASPTELNLFADETNHLDTSDTLKLQESAQETKQLELSNESLSFTNESYGQIDDAVLGRFTEVQKLSESGLYDCAQCGQQFETIRQLRNHMFLHSGKKRHICTLCGANFSCQAMVRIHIKAVHEKVRPFRCTWPGCDYRGALESIVVKHIGALHLNISQKEQKESNFHRTQKSNYSKYLEYTGEN